MHRQEGRSSPGEISMGHQNQQTVEKRVTELILLQRTTENEENMEKYGKILLLAGKKLILNLAVEQGQGKLREGDLVMILMSQHQASPPQANSQSNMTSLQRTHPQAIYGYWDWDY